MPEPRSHIEAKPSERVVAGGLAIFALLGLVAAVLVAVFFFW